MTLAYSPTPIPHPKTQTRDELGGNDVRRGLTALLRRRVPLQEVDDVAQTVLADALAAQVVPTDPDELRRWLSGIARHKIADFHRRTARSNARHTECELESIGGTPAAYEEREVLETLLNEPRTRRDAETMEWLVREHAGERLQDIAAENRIPSTVVRQRVSRLRRALRSRWVGVFSLVALLAGLSILGYEALLRPSVAIAPDPTAQATPPVAPASATPVELFSREVNGDWVVQTVTPDRALTPNEKRIVDLQAKGALIHINGKHIDIDTKTVKMALKVDSAEKTANGVKAHIVSDSGLSDSAEIVVRRDALGPRLEVTLRGRFGGTVLLRRPVL